MKRFIILSGILAVLGLAAAARAESDFEAGLGVGGQWLLSGDNLARYTVYDALPYTSTRLLSQGDLGYASGSDYFDAQWAGSHNTFNGDLTAGDAELKLGRYGSFNVDYTFGRIGHTFRLGTPTIYQASSVGTGVLTVDPAVQADLKSTADPTVLPVKLANDMAVANTIDVGLKRDKQGIEATWNALDNLSFKLAATQEQRTGTRPAAAVLPSAATSSVEVPAPVNYTTTELELSAQLTSKDLTGQLAYRHSEFVDNLDSFMFANPFQNADINGGPGNVTQSGAAFGRISLPPSNTCDYLSGLLSQSLPLKSHLAVSVDSSWARENEQIMPSTSNSALTVPDLTGLRVNGQVDSSHMKAALDSRPLEKLKLSAHTGVDSRFNYTPYDRGFVAVTKDSTVGAAMSPTAYVSSVREAYGVNASYEVLSRTELGAGYEKASEKFTNGTADALSEDVYKVSLDNHSFAWSNLRAGYERSQRQADYPDFVFPDLRYMQMFYAADKIRDQATVMETLTPLESVVASLEYVYGKDNYNTNWFGMLNAEDQFISASLEYQPLDWLSISPNYVIESRQNNQRQRNFSAAKGNPYLASSLYPDPRVDPNNYMLVESETSQSIGLDANADFVPGFWNLKLDGAYVITRASLDAYSDVADPAVDNTPWPLQGFRNYDDAKELSLGAKTRFQILPSLGLTLGYTYQNYETDDLNYDGFAQVSTVVSAAGVTTYNNLLFMQILPQSYTVQALYANVDYKF